MEFRKEARPSPIAGTWYTADPGTLAAQMDRFLDDARVSANEYLGRLIGLVSPHAGHRYSGRTAGYAYRLARAFPRKLAVVLSPFHPFISGDFLTTAHCAYRTPLGEVKVAENLVNGLDKSMGKSGLRLTQVAEDEEHSLEIQLPFLQRAWQADFSLLPVMVRAHDPKKLLSFSQALYDVIKDEDFLIVASTDLSHFNPLDYAQALDAEMLKRVKAMDPAAVLRAEQEGSASACGAGAVAIMLWTARLVGADRAYILNYSTSADSTGDSSSVVGYGAAAVFSPD